MNDNITYWLNMGNALFYGRDGAIKNPEKARRWFEMAAEAGSDEAKEMLKKYRSDSFGLGTTENRAEDGYTAESDSVIDYLSSDMPEEYKASCHKIIHASATSAAVPAAGLAQVPCSDTFFITPIQIAMIIALGNVFNMRIGESVAKSILTSVAASLTGRSMSQFLIGWFPGWGNALNATTAIAVTETIGWMAADHFYKIKLEEDNKIIDAVSKNDNAHGEKERELHEAVESQKEAFEKIIKEYEDIIQGYEQ